MSASHPTRRNSIKLKIAVILAKEQDGYFLFFKFRIATIRSPIVKSTINSSYVVIIPTTFRWVSDWVRARPPAPRLSILYCHGAVIPRFEIGKIVYLKCGRKIALVAK